jgi:hypothetical protein
MAPTPVPDAQAAWQIFLALIPVITGGLIGIIGGLGPIAFGRYLQSKEEKKALKRAKLETLVTHIFEIEHWATRTRHHYVFDSAELPYELNPTSRITSLTSIYFPTLQNLATQLDHAADQYEIALMSVRKNMLDAAVKAAEETATKLTAENPANPNLLDLTKLAAEKAKLPIRANATAFEEPFKRVLVARKALLTEARALAEQL